jgi:hypothetical protein
VPNNSSSCTMSSPSWLHPLVVHSTTRARLVPTVNATREPSPEMADHSPARSPGDDPKTELPIWETEKKVRMAGAQSQHLEPQYLRVGRK